MNWQKWALIAWLTFGAIVSVTQIGKPKKPTTPGVAAISLVLTLGVIALVVTA